MPADPSIIPPTPSQAEYEAVGDRPLIADAADPFTLFAQWFTQARASHGHDANAMSLATVDADGLPDVRTVLLKDFSPAGFTFYTNLTSAKAHQIGQSGKAALLFHWTALERQVRLRGEVHRASEAEADAYFESRARVSQIGAWVSEQSQPLADRETLKARVAMFRSLHEDDVTIERPAHWGGFVLRPQSVEFWQAQAFRLHDRLSFEATPDGWKRSRLYP